MEIERVIVGELNENCYVISKDKECIIIDPGSEFEKIKELVRDRKVVGVLITHHHFDHVGALKEVIAYYHTNYYDFNTLQEGENTLGNFTFDVVFNPGHTKDSISFYFKEKNVMFVGDFIFLDSIGRCDLEGGSFKEIKQSIEKIKKFSDDIILYPGHGSKTMLGYEKMHNSFFK